VDAKGGSVKLRHVYFRDDVAINEGDRVPFLTLDGDAHSPSHGYDSLVRNDDGMLVCRKGERTFTLVGYAYACVLLEGQERLPITGVVVPGGCTTRIEGETLYVIPSAAVASENANAEGVSAEGAGSTPARSTKGKHR
jgi:hypothetical protein